MCEHRPDERPPLGVIAAFREEGTCAPLLREMAAYLLEPGRSEIVTLQALGLSDSITLFCQARGIDLNLREALLVHQETGGSPALLLARAASDGEQFSTNSSILALHAPQIGGNLLRG